jgi:hypothetical protein
MVVATSRNFTWAVFQTVLQMKERGSVRGSTCPRRRIAGWKRLFAGLVYFVFGLFVGLG